jgi:molybdenum cofactor cytidylyltransferase
MILVDAAPADAVGGLLIHGVKIGARTVRKGRVLTGEDCDALTAAGVTSVTIGRLDPGDVGEDAAAEALARELAGPGLRVQAPFTGRANLIATTAGLLRLDAAAVTRLNALDEAVTLATLPDMAPIAPDQMVATIKIIPYAVAGGVMAGARDRAAAARLAVAPFQPKRVALIQTTLPTIKDSVLDGTRRVTADRLAALGATLTDETRVAHQVAALASTIVATEADILLIAGASAVADRGDVLPTAITAAGGVVEHLGMPVDPGNLLVFGHQGGRPVVGLPGCARSPKLNGFDWVLQRLIADLPVGRSEIVAMGVGGLLKEIATRPQPRAGDTPAASDGARVVAASPRAARIAALVLAAGRASRMGRNKLILTVDGAPMVARVVDMLVASAVRDIVVVVGHDADPVREALDGRPVRFVVNPDHAAGLSTSLRAGVAALPADADGFLVALGDMPRVTAADVDRLIAAYDPDEGRLICVPTHGGRAGNPVLWDRRFVPEMTGLVGDQGARSLLRLHGEAVVEVPVEGAGVLLDIDTPAALAAISGKADAQ